MGFDWFSIFLARTGRFVSYWLDLALRLVKTDLLCPYGPFRVRAIARLPPDFSQSVEGLPTSSLDVFPRDAFVVFDGASRCRFDCGGGVARWFYA